MVYSVVMKSYCDGAILWYAQHSTVELSKVLYATMALRPWTHGVVRRRIGVGSGLGGRKQSRLW